MHDVGGHGAEHAHHRHREPVPPDDVARGPQLDDQRDGEPRPRRAGRRARGAIARTRKSDADSPMAVVSALVTQKIAATSGTRLGATARVRVGSLVVTRGSSRTDPSDSLRAVDPDELPAARGRHPARAHAWNPPITSVARCSPRSASAAAARLDVYPSEHRTTTCRSWLVAAGMRCALVGSRRHSSTLRSITTACGTSPSAARWAAGRMSTSSAPSLERAPGVLGREPVEACAGLGEHVVDGPRHQFDSGSSVTTVRAGTRTPSSVRAQYVIRVSGTEYAWIVTAGSVPAFSTSCRSPGPRSGSARRRTPAAPDGRLRWVGSR